MYKKRNGDENGVLRNQRKDKQKMDRTKEKTKVKEKRKTEKQSQCQKEISLCRETQLRICEDLKRCDHWCIMSESTSLTLPTALALRNTPVNLNLNPVINEV